MRIQRLKTSDASRVQAAVALLEAAHDRDFPDGPKVSLSWERGRMRVAWPGSIEERWVAVCDDEVRGVLVVELPERDNVTSARIELTVHPSSRRQSIGSALLDHARARSCAAGRKLLIVEAVMGGGTETFLRRHGAMPGIVEHRQRMAVEPDGPVRWDRLLSDALPQSDGYTVVRWGSVTPDEFAEGMTYLRARMTTDAPQDQLDWKPEFWDAGRIRDWDQAAIAWGRRGYTTAVVHDASRSLVAYTTLSYAEDDPTVAWQWNTLVEPAHRGHRLGTVVKVKNLQFALEMEPGTRTVITSNAESNGPMNAINFELGFRPIDRWGRWQLPLT